MEFPRGRPVEFLPLSVGARKIGTEPCCEFPGHSVDGDPGVGVLRGVLGIRLDDGAVSAANR
jgi:hypothetical protein